RRENDARNGEDDLDVVLFEHGREPSATAEEQYQDEPGDHRRDAEGQIDYRDQRRASRKVVLGDEPRRDDSEDGIERNRDQRSQQGEADRGQSLRFHQGLPVGAEPAREGGAEHRDERRHEEEADEGEGRGDQDAPRQPAFGGEAASGPRLLHRSRARQRATHRSALPVQRWSTLTPKRIANAANSITEAIAVASAYSYCSSLVTIKSG